MNLNMWGFKCAVVSEILKCLFLSVCLSACQCVNVRVLEMEVRKLHTFRNSVTLRKMRHFRFLLFFIILFCSFKLSIFQLYTIHMHSYIHTYINCCVLVQSLAAIWSAEYKKSQWTFSVDTFCFQNLGA